MSYSILVQSQAEEEIDSICQYYEDHSSDLGIRFREELFDYFDKIQSMPTRYRFYHENIQYVNLKTFPYQIFYEVDESQELIYIRAVFHQKKHPDNKTVD